MVFLQIERAVRDGFDVRGMFYWTLIDNFVSAFSERRSPYGMQNSAYTHSGFMQTLLVKTVA